MNCTICGKPVVLVPSATERAAKSHPHQPASHYTRLFKAHAACQIEKRERETRELILRLNPNPRAVVMASG